MTMTFTVEPKDKFPDLPGGPLAKLIKHLAHAEERADNVFSPIKRDHIEGKMPTVCRRAGVDTRTVYSWEGGANVKFETADKVLCRLEIHWDDVRGWESDPKVRYAFTGEI